MRVAGPQVAAKLCDDVKLPTKLARSLGYEDFHDHKVLFLSCIFRTSSRQTSWQITWSIATLHVSSTEYCAAMSQQYSISELHVSSIESRSIGHFHISVKWSLGCIVK